MPSRNRAREEAKAKRRAELMAKGVDPDIFDVGKKAGKKRRRKKKARPTDSGRRRRQTGPMFDPSAVEDAEIRFVMSGEATKAYRCPGCNRDIPPAMGHLVAVPPDEPDLRRHWHRGCWQNRHTRF